MPRRLLMLVGLITVLFTGAARAEMPAQAEYPAIRAVIQAQLDAFQADDGITAFSYASPTIQSMFGDAPTFMRMVRTGYPQVYRPQQVEFMEIIDVDGRPTQLVFVIGPDGDAVIANYFMEKQPDGTWKIDGCVLEQADGALI